MTDRELLELAAKAAGINYNKTTKEHDYKFGLWLVITGEPNEFTRRSWNPLVSDGDALRLAVKLNILTYQTGGDQSYASTPMNWSCTIPHESNPYAATRRAIVRAAAEIGASL